jgi:dihydroxy-acid dehydratase
MGTASTMTAATEALGLSLPGANAIPAVDANHAKMASLAGRQIVELVWRDVKPRDLLTAAAFDNAIVTTLALGGSTNAVIHLIAMARRAGIPLTLDRFNELGMRTPVLANIRPGGFYLTEDFYYAGGLPALLQELSGDLNLHCRTVSGKTQGENIAGSKIYNTDVIRPLKNPLISSMSLAIPRGNLAPQGAVAAPKSN